MSELTSYDSERIYWAVEQVEREAGDIDELHLDDNLFYDKSKADKVIEEKDKQLRHSNHKRCLAMAQVLEHVCPITNRKAKWRDRWHNRWLELAEKFKEAKYEA